jgi:hypothetical protein
MKNDRSGGVDSETHKGVLWPTRRIPGAVGLGVSRERYGDTNSPRNK